MANMNIAIKIAADVAGAVGPIGSLKNTLSGLGEAAGRGFSGLQSVATLAGGAALAGVGALAGGITALTLGAAASADEMVELADKTGLTTTQIQEFRYIGEQTGTSLETVTGSLAKLTRNMASAREGSGGAAEAFAALGINVVDSNGQLRDSQTVFGEALDSLGRMTNETERDALAMAILGKSAQELNPLIKAGSEGMAEMSQQAQAMGAVMSEEAVAGLADLNDMVAGLKLGFQGWIGTLASSFLPIFREVIGSVQGFMASPAVQAGVADFMANLRLFAEGAAAAIGAFVANLQEGMTPLNAFIEAIWDLAPPEVLAFLVTLRDDILPGLSEFFTNNVQPIIDFVTQFVSWKDVLLALGVVVASIVLPALYGVVAAAAPVIAVGAALVGAIALARTAWENDWGGIRTAVTGAWAAIQPALDQVKTILGNFTDLILPPLQLAWQALGQVWQTEIGPALAELWTSLQELFAELGIGTGDTDLWSAALGILKLGLAGVVVGVRLLTPVIHIVAGAIRFGIDTVRTFVDGLISLKRAAEQIIEPLQAVANKIADLIASALEMPDWLIPGSPTPFEVGLRGIGEAARSMPALTLPAPSGSGEMRLPSSSGSGGLTPNFAGVTFGPGAIVINAPGGEAAVVKSATEEGMMAAFRAVGLR